MKRILLAFIALFAIPAMAAERSTSLEEYHHSCCRIYNGSTAGSGTAFQFNEDTGDVFVVTNNHVAGGVGNNVQMHFFPYGAKNIVSGTVVGSVRNESTSTDVSIIKVSNPSVCDYFTPFYNGKIENGKYHFWSFGCPHALRLNGCSGTITINGDGNAEFTPTPYGGQSGSSIVIDTEDQGLRICAIITWRTKAESDEVDGGLAQTSMKVINAINRGQVNAGYNTLPPNAVTLPADTNELFEEASESIEINVDGKPAWEVSESLVSNYEVQAFTQNGCDPCYKFKVYGAKKVTDLGFKLTYYDFSSVEANGITNVPTFRILKDGVMIKQIVGFSTSEYDPLIVYLQGIVKEEQEKAKTKLELEKPKPECNDDTCLLTKPKPKVEESNNTGSFIFKEYNDKPKKEEPKQEKKEKNKLLPIIPKDEDSPSLIQPFGGKLKDKLEEGLNKQKKGLMENFVAEFGFKFFLLMYAASLLAIMTVGTVKKALSFVYNTIKNALTLDKFAERIAEKITITKGSK